jgi:hypothetical protein
VALKPAGKSHDNDDDDGLAGRVAAVTALVARDGATRRPA